jgi:hypothetical protein
MAKFPYSVMKAWHIHDHYFICHLLKVHIRTKCPMLVKINLKIKSLQIFKFLPLSAMGNNKIIVHFIMNDVEEDHNN